MMDTLLFTGVPQNNSISWYKPKKEIKTSTMKLQISEEKSRNTLENQKTSHPMFIFWKINIVIMTILPKAIYRFNGIVIKYLQDSSWK